ncbi:MAG TPA: bifunctional phosphoribosyl-AMP cyclohydrolase/phosphoribosyl-ATP diphosphatase HisIE [Nitrospirota bacterium]|nr:bifunctional phosphoribosyl-AMP cyclohydrolase/phosphoribosyl-ATP diphosphatase HisIE [Nitrospirota bacterium]
MNDFINQIRFNSNGLVPAIIQDSKTLAVLMMAYMNDQALRATIKTGISHFWSRSRQKLWQKGETSGNIQRVKKILYDCDADTLLLLVDQTGVACHTGSPSCFFRELYERVDSRDTRDELDRTNLSGILNTVYDVIIDRRDAPSDTSYVSSLYSSGLDKILKKISEESGELIISSKNNNRDEIVYEAADLWFHSLVLLGYHGLSPQDVCGELEKRFGVSGLEKKKREGKTK